MLFIFRNFHPIILKRLSQYRKIKTKSVVRHHRLVLDKWFYQMPDLIKSGCVSGNFRSDVVNINKPIPIKVIRRLNQNAEFIGNQTVFNSYQSNLTNTPVFTVCCFKINCSKSVFRSVHIQYFPTKLVAN